MSVIRYAVHIIFLPYNTHTVCTTRSIGEQMTHILEVRQLMKTPINKYIKQIKYPI